MPLGNWEGGDDVDHKPGELLATNKMKKVDSLSPMGQKGSGNFKHIMRTYGV